MILAVMGTVLTSSTTLGAVENGTTWEAISNITGFSEIRDVSINSAGDSIIVLSGITIYEIQLEDASVVRKLRLEFGSTGVMDWNDDHGWLAIRVTSSISEKIGGSPLAVIDLDGEVVALFSPWGSLPSYLASDVVDLAWRPGTSHLAVFFKDGTLRIYDISGQSLVREYKFATSASRIEWSPSGGLLAILTKQTASGDGIDVYDVEQNTSWTALPTIANINDIGWSRDSRFLFRVTSGKIRRLDISSNDWEIILEASAVGIAPSPAEDIIVLIEERNGITFWNYEADTFECHENAQSLSFEADWTTDGSYFYIMEKETLVIRIFARAGSIPPPRVGINFPATGMVVSGVVEVSGWASSHYENFTTVSVKIGSNEWMPAEGRGTWRLDINTTNVPDGWVNIRARAVDPAGTSEIAIARVQVQNQDQPGNEPPRVWIDAPEDGATVWTVARFLGGASDDHGIVSVQVRGSSGPWKIAELDMVGSTTGWSIVLDFVTITGDFIIQVRAYDGHLFSEVVSQNLTVSQPPSYLYTVEILYPAEGSNVSNAFSISGIVRGGTPEVVYVRLDDGPTRIVDGTLSWSIEHSGVPRGRHRAFALAVSASGVSRWSSVVFYVGDDAENQPPKIGIDVPQPGVVVQGDLRARGWSADDAKVESVSVRVNGGEWVEVDGTTEWTFLVRDNDLDEGWNDIEVRAFDGELYSETNTSRFYFVPGGLHVGGASQILLWISILLAIITTAAVVFALRLRSSVEKSNQDE